IPVDTVWSESELEGYEVCFAPHLKIVDKALADKLSKFVKEGGSLVLGAQSGLKDKNCHIVELVLPGLLKTLASIEIDAWTTLPEKEPREATLLNGRKFNLNTFIEKLTPNSAEAAAYWSSEDPLIKGSAAITIHQV